MKKNKKVVIIGAGCAGLAAAYALKKEGVDFVLLESGSNYGGRCQSYHFDPEHPEYYYTSGAVFTEPTEEEAMRLLEELDLMDKYHALDKQVMGLYFDDEVHYLKNDGNLAHALSSVKGMPAAIVPQALKFGANLAKTMKLLKKREGDSAYGYDELVEKVSGYSTAEWGEKYGGKEIVDKMLAPMVGGIVLDRPENISVVQPLFILSRLSGIGQIEGGHDTIHTEMYKRFKDDVRLNTKVERIAIEDGKVTGVKLADGEFIEADDVICATEGDNALRLLPDAPQYIKDALATILYSKSFCYTFYFDKRPWPEHTLLFLIAPSSGSKLTTMFEENANDVLAAPGSSMLRVYTASVFYDEFAAMSEEERIKAVREEAGRILPELKEGGELISKVTYELGEGVHGMGTQPAGQFEALYAMDKTYKDDVKGLHLAGAYRVLHCATTGAYESGRVEAEAVAAKVK